MDMWPDKWTAVCHFPHNIKRIHVCSWGHGLPSLHHRIDFYYTVNFSPHTNCTEKEFTNWCIPKCYFFVMYTDAFLNIVWALDASFDF
jgi:hypothetical protein